jgi:hypothetical protein
MVRMQVRIEARSSAVGDHFANESRIGQSVQAVVDGGTRGSWIPPVDGGENFFGRGVYFGLRQISEDGIPLRCRPDAGRSERFGDFWDQIRQNLTLE